MLHILWLIIKWILILAGILLGLVLLVLLIVLLVPVRYQAEGGKDDKGWRADLGITWLARAVSVQAKVKDGNTDLAIRLFGITMEQYKAFFDKFRRKKKAAAPAGKKAGDSRKTESLTEREESENVEENVDGPEREGSSEKAVPVPPNARRRPKRKNKPSLWKKIKEIFGKIVHFPGKIWAKIKKTALTIRSFCGKMNQWRRFVQDSRVKAAVRLLLGTVKKLLKHAGPKKISGHVHFGLEDPASTGYVLAALGATCPIHKNQIQILPSFEEKILEGEIAVKGRVFGVILLKLVLEVYFNKNFKYAWKTLKNKEG